MSLVQRIFHLPVSSERLDLRLGQWACFAASPAFLFVALVALSRLSLTPGEIFLGLLGSLAVALLLVILGIVLPLAYQGPPRSC